MIYTIGSEAVSVAGVVVVGVAGSVGIPYVVSVATISTTEPDVLRIAYISKVLNVVITFIIAFFPSSD